MAQLPRLDSATAEFLQRADSLAVSAGGLFALPDLSSGPPSFDGLQPFGNGSGLVRQLSFDPLRSALSSGGNGDFMPPPPKRPHLSSEADAAAMHSVLGPLPAPVAAGHRGEHTRVAEPDAAFAELKHADHRRLLSRWGKALFRYAGIKRDDFTRRQGSYRENFTNVLQVCFGSCFDGPGSYWYDNSNAGAFAAALLYCATSGRVRVSDSDAYALFIKKEPNRAASSWQVNEVQLVEWGVAPGELKRLFLGPSRKENGFPRGTPLLLPAMDKLPPPSQSAAVIGAAARAAGAATLAAAAASGVWNPGPAHVLPFGGAMADLQGPSMVQPLARTSSELAAMSQPLATAPSLPLMSFSNMPLQRQSTVATLALLMAQNDYLERESARTQGRTLDRTFSDGARAFMAAVAGGAALTVNAPPPAQPDVQLGTAAPLWARQSVGQ